MKKMQLSKTDFIHFLSCAKSLWLLKHKPETYPHGKFSNFARKLTKEGYEVEGYVKELLRAHSGSFSFQQEFETSRGLYAKVDVVENNEDDTVNLYEIKSSTSVKRDASHDQVKDIAFQKIVAEEAGHKVEQVFIVHLNRDFVRSGKVKPEELLVFADVTERAAKLEDRLRGKIDQAVELLGQARIDEGSCTCLFLAKGKHCDTFEHFNQEIPNPSIYNLPRIRGALLTKLVEEERFDLRAVVPEEVTDRQKLVVQAAHQGEPYIDRAMIGGFFDRVEYPIYFLDYETYASAIPIVDGMSPHGHLPFQFSLHVMGSKDADVRHKEYLADEAVLPIAFIEELEEHIGGSGSVISWYASFEKTRNNEMAERYPDKAEFLKGVNERTLDLMDIFKTGYVDIAFGGSTSIKAVLPILVPGLKYEGLPVANGTDAMIAWRKMIELPDGDDKAHLRQELLDYCELDTLAMVKIFEKMRGTEREV